MYDTLKYEKGVQNKLHMIFMYKNLFFSVMSWKSWILWLKMLHWLTKGGGGVCQMLTLADKGGRGISQMLTLADKGAPVFQSA